MLKTGFVGCIPDIVYESFSGHPGFEPTGSFNPEGNKPDIAGDAKKNIPVLPLKELLISSDVLIVQKSGPGFANIIAEVLKQSRHVMLLDASGLSLNLVRRITELQHEAQTVVKILLPARTNPALQAAMPMVTHPSLFEIRLFVPRHLAVPSSLCESPNCHLLKMLDALLYLCPVNIQKIRCFSHPPGIASSGLLNARIEFNNGSVANILYSDFTKRKVFSIFIYQKNKLLEVNMDNNGCLNVNNSADTHTIKSNSHEFDWNIAGTEFYCELDSFYQSIILNNHTGKDLFEISKLIELADSIAGKSFLPEPA